MGNLRVVAPRVSCAGNLREHYANMAAPYAMYQLCALRDVSTMRRTPRDTLEKVRPRRPSFFLAAAFSSFLEPTRPRFPFFELGFLQPPAASSSLRAVSPFLSGPPPPQFSSFWPRNVGRGYLCCVCLSWGAAAV